MNPNAANWEEERRLFQEFYFLSSTKESFVRQKSIVTWLKLGDRNISFFYHSLQQKFHKDAVRSLCDEEGQHVSSEEGVKTMVVNYFEDLFKERRPPSHLFHRLEALIAKRVRRLDCEGLIKSVTDEEIKATLFSMAKDKAPGPDGYNANFFQCTWHIIGKDVCVAIKDFFATGRLLKSINSTSLSLVPKKENPTDLRNFRPISCCNTLYKCISKILAERLKLVLPYLVGKEQTAFIKGRRIVDNVFVVQDLLCGYHKDSMGARCAIKVDIMKAYDNV